MSASYLDLTVSVMARCGVAVERPGPRRFRVAAGARYRPGEHRISGDWTTASYFFAAAAIAPGRVTVDGLDPESPQGERGFSEILRRMGCEVTEEPAGDGVRITVTGARRLRGVTVDMGSLPDAAPTLAAVAPFAEGPTRIGGIGHLRHKESDRIAALAEGLRRLGARVATQDDALAIEPHRKGRRRSSRGRWIRTAITGSRWRWRLPDSGFQEYESGIRKWLPSRFRGFGTRCRNWVRGWPAGRTG